MGETGPEWPDPQAGKAGMPSPPLFSEVQRFWDLWWWKLLVVITLAALSGPFALVVAQFFSHPAGVCRPPVPAGAIFPLLAGLLAGGASLFVLIALRLETDVTANGVHVRFRPFHLRARLFPFGEIISAEAVTYRPLVDYGGWGIRYGRKGWAYNVSGNQGVILRFRDRGDLLIGSLKAADLAGEINRRIRPAEPSR